MNYTEFYEVSGILRKKILEHYLISVKWKMDSQPKMNRQFSER